MALATVLCWADGAWQTHEVCYEARVDTIVKFQAALHAGVRHLVIEEHIDSLLPALIADTYEDPHPYFGLPLSTKTIRGNCLGPHETLQEQLKPRQCNLKAYAGFASVTVFHVPLDNVWLDNLYITLHLEEPDGLPSEVKVEGESLASGAWIQGNLWMTHVTMHGFKAAASRGLDTKSVALSNQGNVYLRECIVTEFIASDWAVVNSFGKMSIKDSIFASNNAVVAMIRADYDEREAKPSITKIVNTTFVDNTGYEVVLWHPESAFATSDNSSHRIEHNVMIVGDTTVLIGADEEFEQRMSQELLTEEDTWFRTMVTETGGFSMTDERPTMNFSVPIGAQQNVVGDDAGVLIGGAPDSVPAGQISRERFVAVVSSLGATVAVVAVLVAAATYLIFRRRRSKAPSSIEAGDSNMGNSQASSFIASSGTGKFPLVDQSKKQAASDSAA